MRAQRSCFLCQKQNGEFADFTFNVSFGVYKLKFGTGGRNYVGTFTLTNVGTFGNTMGTPIINPPQVAILATGSIKKKPVVIETELGDTIAIRHMIFLSLSYDHRIVDGFMGGLS